MSLRLSSDKAEDPIKCFLKVRTDLICVLDILVFTVKRIIKVIYSNEYYLCASY